MQVQSIVTVASLGALALAATLFTSNAPRAAATPLAVCAAVGSACINYCTAGTSSNGCIATMSCSGIPSAASLSGFVLTTSSLEGQKSALMRYSITGQNNLPWAAASTSFLCIRAPLQKLSPVRSSGGTFGACDGVLTIDFLDWSVNHPWALGQPLLAGATFYVQTFYKDPPAPKSTNTSDALEFTIVP